MKDGCFFIIIKTYSNKNTKYLWIIVIGSLTVLIILKSKECFVESLKNLFKNIAGNALWILWEHKQYSFCMFGMLYKEIG